MVNLIHHHVVVVILGQLKIVDTITERVLACKHMLVAGRLVCSIPYATEVRIIKHDAKRLHRLSQNLLTMGNEKEMTIWVSLTIALEVKGCNDRLTRTRCSYNKITIIAMNVAFYVKFLQYFLLIILGTHQVKSREIEQWRFPIRTQRFLQAFVANARNEVLKRLVAPIHLKRITNLLNHLWQLKLSGLEIPFFAVL